MLEKLYDCVRKETGSRLLVFMPLNCHVFTFLPFALLQSAGRGATPTEPGDDGGETSRRHASSSADPPADENGRRRSFWQFGLWLLCIHMPLSISQAKNGEKIMCNFFSVLVYPCLLDYRFSNWCMVGWFKCSSLLKVSLVITSLLDCQITGLERKALDGSLVEGTLLESLRWTNKVMRSMT